MENKLGAVTIATAICVSTYAAIAMGCLAQYGLGFSVEEIRRTALATAALIAAFIAIDFLGKKPGKTG